MRIKKNTIYMILIFIMLILIAILYVMIEKNTASCNSYYQEYIKNTCDLYNITEKFIYSAI